jgi:hypothetical protein
MRLRLNYVAPILFNRNLLTHLLNVRLSGRDGVGERLQVRLY